MSCAITGFLFRVTHFPQFYWVAGPSWFPSPPLRSGGGLFFLKEKWCGELFIYKSYGGTNLYGGTPIFYRDRGGGIYSIFCVQICFIDFYWPGIILLWIFSKLFFPILNFFYMYWRHHIKGNWLSEQDLIWYFLNTNMATSGLVMTDSV